MVTQFKLEIFSVLCFTYQGRSLESVEISKLDIVSQWKKAIH